MANYQVVAERLLKGETVTFRPHGHSMTPYIRDGQEVTVRPFKPGEMLMLEDIVLAKVHGRFFLHRIVNVDLATHRIQIGNAHGHVNGWTSRDKIYGIYDPSLCRHGEAGSSHCSHKAEIQVRSLVSVPGLLDRTSEVMVE